MKDLLLIGLKGPLAQPRFLPLFLRLVLVVVLTLWTQVGGLLIWPTLAISVDNLGLKQRLIRIMAPIAAYIFGLFALIPMMSGWFGMERLPCFTENRTPLAARTVLTCLSGRNYVQPHVLDTLSDVANKIHRVYPKLTLHYLDASFPFRGPPLFPHMAHNDGLSVDMSFFWKRKDSDTPVESPSPIGYFGYVAPPYDRQCAPPFLFLGLIPVDLRHDLTWLQSMLPDHVIDLKQTRSLIGFFTARNEVEQIVIEPHLLKRMGDSKGKLVKNLCDQARHDDHFHMDFKAIVSGDDETKAGQ